VHRIFYFLILAMPISGWIFVSPFGPISFLGLFDIPALPTTEAVADFSHSVHEWLGTAFIVLILLHIAGALKHQFGDRVPFLARMGLGTPRRVE
jgi:cytochrome b561